MMKTCLAKNRAKIESVLRIPQHLSFSSRQNFNYLCTPTDDGFIPRVTVNPDFSFGAVRKAVAEIKERLEEFGREELLKISKSGPPRAAEHKHSSYYTSGHKRSFA